MRVIAGELGGRQFEAPKGHRTHPMSEKSRGGLFAALGDIEGLAVLDAFTGSGALSFEAVSRGASQAVAIDVDKRAVNTAAQNVQGLNLADKVKVIRANASGWSDNNPEAKFNMVFLAPPFDNLQLTLLQKLAKHAEKGGIVVLDWPGKLEIPEFQDLHLVKDKNYGDNQIAIYKKLY